MTTSTSRGQRTVLKRLTTWMLWIVGGILALAGIGWAGLQVPPPILPPPTTEPKDLGTVPIPQDLPEPVRRYLEVASGGQVPRVESMETWGRARANFGIWMPLRFHLVHLPGQAFRRDMQVTWFGIPVMAALDLFVDGKGMTGPVGNLETGPHVDQGANMILWAEASFMPSLLITDPRIRWEPIDATSARLIFPLGAGEDEMIFHFDPETGLPTRTWALRHRSADGAKIPWYAETLSWQTIDGVTVPREVAVTWEDQGRPWSIWTFEGITWNTDVSAHFVESSAPDSAP